MKPESYMRWAIALALEGQGTTLPNPMVGAVIVKSGKIVGEGYHRKAGTPHAEIHALRQAGRRARGADIYVTLEPCPHQGRTPPCVPAIIDAGIKRVFIGVRDPNPLVNGRGIRMLKKAGIAVSEGVLKSSCLKINEVYNKFITTGMPHVTAKVALSLDGKLAAEDGDSKWITNRQCRAHIHRLRSQVGAVCVGAGTVRRDEPRLTARLSGWHGTQPKAVVIDEVLRFSRHAKIVKRPRGGLIAATTSRAPGAMRHFLEEKGHHVIVCRATGDGRVSLPHMLRALGKLGIMSILLEGGGQLFADFFRRRLVDRLVVCVAPKLIGGRGIDFLPGISFGHIKDSPALKDVHIQSFGDNVVVEGIVKQ